MMRAEYYTTTQVAEIMQVTEQTVRNWCADGRVPDAIRCPGKSRALWRIPRNSVIFGPKKFHIPGNSGKTPAEKIREYDAWDGINK